MRFFAPSGGIFFPSGTTLECFMPHAFSIVPDQRGPSYDKKSNTNPKKSSRGKHVSWILVNLVKPYWCSLASSALCLIGYSATTLATPRLFGSLLDCASKGSLPHSSVRALLGCFALGGILNAIRLTLVGHVAERIAQDIRVASFFEILNKPCSFHDEPENSSTILAQNIVQDSTSIGASLSESVSNLAKNAGQVVGSLFIMVYLSAPLTLGMMLMLPPMVLLTGMYGRFVRTLNAKQHLFRSELIARTAERFALIHTVKAFNKESLEMDYFTQQGMQLFSLSQLSTLGNASNTSFVQTMGYLTLLGLLYLGSMLISRGTLTPGKLFSFTIYTVYCGIGIMGVGNTVTELFKTMGATEAILEWVGDAKKMPATLPNQLSDCSSIPPCVKSPNLIVFDRVTFSYPTRESAVVYDGLSFQVPRGTCTAVLGASGVGKSTLGKLILGLYNIQKGSIHFNELALHHANKTQLQDLRKRVSYVIQEPSLFRGTIAQNIAYGVNGYNSWNALTSECLEGPILDVVYKASVRANAHDFIMKLPKKYNTDVGESGNKLSGGQKQRIALARAFIRSPELIILDEPTSALDAQCVQVLHETVRELTGQGTEGAWTTDHPHTGYTCKSTVLLFTHRIESVLELAQHVIIISGGKAVYEGPVGDRSSLEQLIGQ